MVRRNLEINGQVYSVTRAIEYSRELLKTKGVISKKTEAYKFVLWMLLKRRPHLINVSPSIKVGIGADTKNNCFYYKERNKEWESFSYRKALEPEHRKIESVEGIVYSKNDYFKAFRNAVYDQIKAFRDKEIEKPENKHLKLLNKKDPFLVHTDHIIPMHILTSDFLGDRGIEFKDIELQKIIKFNTDNYEIKDEELRKEWRAYHKKNARLKLMKMQENLSKAGSYDVPLYRYKAKRGETYDTRRKKSEEKTRV